MAQVALPIPIYLHRFAYGPAADCYTMVEQHPFGHYLPTGAKTLIMGSFPCFNGEDYGPWFYGGSGKNFFWPLMSAVFDLPASTREQQQALCDQHGLALTDIAGQVIRTHNNCSDSNLHILAINSESIEHCLSAGIERIVFTSRFVWRTFLRHYPANILSTDVLISPSPAANRHVACLPEYRQLLASQEVSSVFEYRLLKYRQAFLVNPA